jgi:homoserine O-acetyltransferase
MAPGTERRPGAPRSRRYPLGTGEVIAADLGPFVPEAGGPPLPLTLAYRHDGPGPDAPQLLVIHALTGSADAAGDWWQPLIGPGDALDTDQVGVLCANLVGSRYGSTGPTSLNAATGRPWDDDFPIISARDEARALWLLADELGIDQLALVTGGSLGGMVALEVALARPESVAHVAPIAAPAATGGLALAWNHIQLELIDRLGEDGLDLARQLAMTTYRSEADFDTRFGRDREADGRFSVASYLDHQGQKLLARFDAATYRTLVRVMDGHDIGRDRGGIQASLRGLGRSGSGLTGVGIEGDILYGPGQVQALVDAATSVGVDAGYREIHSPKGHDAFLTEWDQLGRLLAESLADGIERQNARAAAVTAGVA